MTITAVPSARSPSQQQYRAHSLFHRRRPSRTDDSNPTPSDPRPDPNGGHMGLVGRIVVGPCRCRVCTDAGVDGVFTILGFWASADPVVVRLRIIELAFACRRLPRSLLLPDERSESRGAPNP